MFSGLGWDFVGENPLGVEDRQLERICAAMRTIRASKPETYRVLYTLYVDQLSVKKAGGRLGISRRRVSDLKLDGIIFLSGFLLGAEYIDEPGQVIQRWGERPAGEVRPPESMQER